MGSGLADFLVALMAWKTERFSSSWHLIDGDGNRPGIGGSGNRASTLLALQNVNAIASRMLILAWSLEEPRPYAPRESL